MQKSIYYTFALFHLRWTDGYLTVPETRTQSCGNMASRERSSVGGIREISTRSMYAWPSQMSTMPSSERITEDLPQPGRPQIPTYDQLYIQTDPPIISISLVSVCPVKQLKRVTMLSRERITEDLRQPGRPQIPTYEQAHTHKDPTQTDWLSYSRCGKFNYRFFICCFVVLICFQCFDTVGWAAGRASGP